MPASQAELCPEPDPGREGLSMSCALDLPQGRGKQGYTVWLAEEESPRDLNQCRRVEQVASCGDHVAQLRGQGAPKRMLYVWIGEKGVGRQRAGQPAGLRVTQQTKPPTLAWYF